MRSVLEGLNNVIQKSNSKEATQAIQEVKSVIGEVLGYVIKSPLSKARRFFRKEEPDREKALEFLRESLEVLTSEIARRKAAKLNVPPAVRENAESLKPTVGIRSWPRFSEELSKEISACQADHRDVSLCF